MHELQHLREHPRFWSTCALWKSEGFFCYDGSGGGELCGWQGCLRHRGMREDQEAGSHCLRMTTMSVAVICVDGRPPAPPWNARGSIGSRCLRMTGMAGILRLLHLLSGLELCLRSHALTLLSSSWYILPWLHAAKLNSYWFLYPKFISFWFFFRADRMDHCQREPPCQKLVIY